MLKLNLGLREPFFLPRSHITDLKFGAKALAQAGVQIEKSLRIFEPVEIRPMVAASCIKIGNGIFINSGGRFCAEPNATITIGRRVAIGPWCSFETKTHSVDLIDGRRTGENKSIVIEDNVVGGGFQLNLLKTLTIRQSMNLFQSLKLF